MHDRPTAPELLDAMAVQLGGEVREWVPRERRFQILVLANLCAVLGRELRAGDEPLRLDAELFEELGGGPAGGDPRMQAAVLARRIRSGELDDYLPELIERLQEHVSRKLEVSRPGYTA
jgi:hypothetical protein